MVLVVVDIFCGEVLPSKEPAFQQQLQRFPRIRFISSVCSAQKITKLGILRNPDLNLVLKSLGARLSCDETCLNKTSKSYLTKCHPQKGKNK